MNVVHVIVHTPEQVRGIVGEAQSIADDFDRDGSDWTVIFNKAADLLGSRVTIQTQQAQIPLDLAHLKAARQ